MDLLSLIRRVGEAADDVPGIRAYHSSPRKFRTFDPDRIGSTTGASVGYGHYLTDDLDYSRQYKPPRGYTHEFAIQVPPETLMRLNAPVSPEHLEAARQWASGLPGGHYKQLAEEAVASQGEAWNVYDYARKALAPSMGDAASRREAVQRLHSLGINGFLEDSQAQNVYVMFPGTEDKIRYLRSLSMIPPAVGAALSQQQQEGSTAPGVSAPRQ